MESSRHNTMHFFPLENNNKRNSKAQNVFFVREFEKRHNFRASLACLFGETQYFGWFCRRIYRLLYAGWSRAMVIDMIYVIFTAYTHQRNAALSTYYEKRIVRLFVVCIARTSFNCTLELYVKTIANSIKPRVQPLAIHCKEFSR